MPLPQSFKAMVVTETANKTFVREVKQREFGDLPAGELIIEVKNSSLNYKDALSATGNKGVTRKYPHTPGIDAAGVVAGSTTRSFAVGILAKLGYEVVAATGKSDEKDFLTRLGAKAIISREEANDTSGRPLQKGRWAGVVDTVGGNILATALKTTKDGGLVAACGNAMSADLVTSVYPFILRGVSLLGVNSVDVPMRPRTIAWQKLANEWKVDLSGDLITECSLEELSAKIDLILKGGIRGRVVVDLSR